MRKNSFLYAGLLRLCAGVFMIGLGAFAEPILSIEPSSHIVSPGEIFTLNVTVSEMTDLFAYQFDVGFDPTILSATAIDEGMFLSAVGPSFFVPGTIDNSAGSISNTANTLLGAVSGASGSGVLAELHLRANSAGTSAVGLFNVILIDSTFGGITATARGASVEVSAVPEPSVSWLVLSGLAGLAFGRRHFTGTIAAKLCRKEARRRSCQPAETRTDADRRRLPIAHAAPQHFLNFLPLRQGQ